MSRDLPFDGDDVEVTDPSGDTAYRVANGVARVARAGAYVTGGALVASNGGAPAQPGEQRLDSWHTHWSGNNDPQPDLPSPVVTFPDPTPDSIPLAPSRPSLVAHDEPGHGAPAPVAPPSPNETTLEIRVGAQPRDTVTAWDDARVGAPSFLDSAPTYDSPSDQSWLDYDPEALTPDGSAGGQPWFGYDPSAQPGAGSPWSPGGTNDAGPGLGFEMPDTPAWMTPDKPSDLFAWAEHPAAERSEVGELAETAEDGTTPLGFGSGYHPWAPTHGVDGAQAAELMDSFDDFGVYVGVDAHASLYTEFEIDFGIGPTGAWFNTEMRVEVEAGATVKTAAGSNIGDQLDNLSDWLDGGKSTGATGRNGAEQSGLGGSSPFGANAAGAPGALGPVGPTAPAPAGPAPAAAQPAAFAAPPAPVAMAQAPVAPPPAPVLAAPVAAAPVVAATPLQTTIQPDVASTPVAHVFTPPPGPSPLTAPAATVPVLFDHHPSKHAPQPPQPTKPVDTGADHHTPPPVTKIPTTVLPTPASPRRTPGR
ncbi:hypothetical protein ACTD5D_32590 [Nocardia takedensis]|uniref:hypothetical protein n=1 Tax=Nocardia takedensis TaxID=259390 RepID=UPI003F773EEF